MGNILCKDSQDEVFHRPIEQTKSKKLYGTYSMENQQPKRLYLNSDMHLMNPRQELPTPKSTGSHQLMYSSSNYNRSFEVKPQSYLINAIAAK